MVTCTCSISASSVFYGFTAAATHGTISYNTHAHVEFPVVLSNIGGGYNARSHEFTCPVSGVYMFSMAIINYHGESNAVNLIVNGHLMVSTNADGVGGNTWDHSTNVVVANCGRGQKVWGRSVRSIKIYNDGNNYSTFSGMLLHRN